MRKGKGRTIDGLKIDILIAEKGLLKSEFSPISGVSPQTLSNAIRTNRATMLTIVRIAKTLNVPVESLLVSEG